MDDGRGTIGDGNAKTPRRQGRAKVIRIIHRRDAESAGATLRL
jgi:hypothetical protein